jgi:hypothetical protein
VTDHVDRSCARVWRVIGDAGGDVARCGAAHECRAGGGVHARKIELADIGCLCGAAQLSTGGVADFELDRGARLDLKRWRLGEAPGVVATVVVAGVLAGTDVRLGLLAG